MKRVEATVSGRVQGVYYRETTRRQAQRLGITGWVANKPDGTVQVVAEGSEQALQSLIDFLHEGPAAASVESVKLHWTGAAREFEDFRVRWW